MQTALNNEKISVYPPFYPSPMKKGIYRRFIKRPLDFVLVLMALVFLSPVLLAVTILVKVKLGSPVIFKQKRPGLNEKIFVLYKFRTMTDKRDDSGELLPDEVRLTKFGKFLRSTSMDELPELINIAKNDMAIVGPRPLLISYLPYYTETEKLRHTVRPGLTGLAQVSGRNFLMWNDRLAKDVEYSSSISFIGDVLIILKTFQKVFNRDGIAVNTNAIEGNLAEMRQMEKQALEKEN